MTQTLYRVSYAHLSQSCDRNDAVQECLCRAWQKRHQLKDACYMQTWVIRILINACHDIQRKRGREVPGPGDAWATLPAAPPDADVELHDALLRLEPALRVPIVLHYMEGYAIREIAQILRLPEGTIKTRMASGRRALKHMLSEV